MPSTRKGGSSRAVASRSGVMSGPIIGRLPSVRSFISPLGRIISSSVWKSIDSRSDLHPS